MGIYNPTNTYRDFDSTLKEGNYGEDLLRKFMAFKGFEVEDLSYIQEYREKDIDFKFRRVGGKWKTIEVKTDNRMANTGNIVVEVAMNRQSGKVPGWLYYCEADYLCFVDSHSYKFIFINWPKLQKLVFKGYWKVITFENGTDGCTGELCKVPIKDLKKLGLIVVEDTIYFG